MINHKRIFNGGINADSDFELVEPNQWVNASNIRTFSTDGGVSNIIESVGGTASLYSSLPTGTNICIGGCADEENNWIVWFNYNSAGEHGIYCYDKKIATGYKVLLSSQSSFTLSKDRYVHSCCIINGILYWTDIKPYRINIKAGINMNHVGTFPSVTAYIAPLDSAVISLLKAPPINAPTFAISFAVTAFNFVADETFRFASRFNYLDNEISVLSAWSAVADLRQKFAFTATEISVVVNTPIPQDVISIDLIMQFPLTSKASVVKTWYRSNAADLIQINANSVYYLFQNDVFGIGIDDVDIVKTQEQIPTEVATLAIAKNRLFLANYKLGYASPTATSLAFTGLQTTNIGSAGVLAPQRVFKSDTFYDIGIEFYDKELRRCGVVSGPNVYSGDAGFYVDYNESTTAPTLVPKTTGINLTLNNTFALTEIPNWAYYYRIVRNKASTTDFFMQGHTVNIEYAYRNTTTLAYVKSTSSTGIISTDGVFPLGCAVNIYNIILNKLGYSFTEGSGDILKIYFSNGVKIVGQIIDVQDKFVFCTLEAADVAKLVTWNAITTGKAAMFEIYSPKKQSTTKVYYQDGSSFYAVTNPTLNTRVYSTTAIQLTPDAWMVKRYTNNPFAIYLEAMSPNDTYWQDWVRSETNPNLIDTIGQKHIQTSILFSNVFIPGTKVNGLSSFEALNETVLDPENGAINKLELVQKIQTDGTVMLALCAYETVSCYLGEQELFDTQGSAFVARANNVIGNTKTLQGGFGTSNPESVTSYNGLLWWWDIRNGCAVQYSGNGLFPISKNKFTRPANLFSKKFASLLPAAIEALGSRPFIIGGYDPHHKELLFTIPATEATAPKGNLVDYTAPTISYPYDIYDGQGKTLIYKTEADRFLGSMSFQAENFVRLGNDLFSFKNGVLHIHNQATPANFYGTQYTAKLMYASNPKGINTFLTIGLEANKKPLFVHAATEDPYKQSSDLVANDFTAKDGVKYAPLFRDRLSPNNTGTYLQKQMIGDKLFGKALLTMLEFTVSDKHLQLRFSNVGHILNEGHNI